MAQPAAYNRLTSFTNYQASNPTTPLPGDDVDAELNAIKATLDDILDNLELIQRDDGDLANNSVGFDQLAEEVEIGFNAPEVWVTGTDYVAGSDTVFNGSAFYRCLEDHTAGTFATDLAADKWEEIVDLSDLTIVAASQIANTPAGNIAATTVQAAINELDSEKAALSHTHAASAISDSTAAGRTLLTAANVAAQRTALGLGLLALEDTVPVTDIDANIKLSGIIEPSALAANTNDWAPTGLTTCSTIRASANSAINLTGITALSDGSIILLENIGSFNITLKASDTNSSAANRFLFTKHFVLKPNCGVFLKYDADGTTPRWRMVGTTANTTPLPRSYLSGFTLSNNGSDATNDIDITAGACRDSTDAVNLVGSAMTKRLDANWAAGTNQGFRNSAAAITNTTYHIYAVGKDDADDTVDYYAHTSAVPATVLTALQAESGGSGYGYVRRIGSIVRTGGAIKPFTQVGDHFQWTTPVVDYDTANPGTSAVTPTLTLPAGLTLLADIVGGLNPGTNNTNGVYFNSTTQTDAAAHDPGTAALATPAGTVYARAAGAGWWFGRFNIRTNTTPTIRFRLFVSGANDRVSVTTHGWFDRRGRDD